MGRNGSMMQQDRERWTVVQGPGCGPLVISCAAGCPSLTLMGGLLRGLLH